MKQASDREREGERKRERERDGQSRKRRCLIVNGKPLVIECGLGSLRLSNSYSHFYGFKGEQGRCPYKDM